MSGPTTELVQHVHDALLETYGVVPPPPIVTLYAMAIEANAGATHHESFYDDLYVCFIEPGGFQLTRSSPLSGPASDRYAIMLPMVELFEFATPSVDGIQYGFVVHAPELGLTDYPMAEWDPRGDSGHLHGIGRTCREGLETLLSRTLARWDAVHSHRSGPPVLPRPGDRDRLAALAKLLDLQLDEARSNVLVVETGEPPVPHVPDGWRFVPTFDGIGVLARMEAFGVEHEALDPEDADAIDEVVELAEHALVAGHPASALCVIREALGRHWRIEEAVAALLPTMERAYRALGRPVFADLVGRVR